MREIKFRGKRVEIIGNRFDNPELLKEVATADDNYTKGDKNV
jgi:hypothetical protein